MKNFFKRCYLFFCWSRYLRCKHCCIWCKYYDDCVGEIKELESKLDINSFFD